MRRIDRVASLVSMLLAACGATAPAPGDPDPDRPALVNEPDPEPAQVVATDRPDPEPVPLGDRPDPEPVPLGDDDVPCESREDCADGEQCQSPEDASWNFCGASRQPDCPDGWTGDHCGNCFLACTDDAPCPSGLHCNGAMCVSPLRCMQVRPPPP